MTEVVVARTVEDLRRLAPTGRLIAGGTDMLVQMRAGRREQRLVDVSNLADGPASLSEEGDLLVISALCPLSRVVAALAGRLPALARAAALFGSLQVRNRATIGGNLANASPAADIVPPLVAADAVVVVHGPGPSREIPAADLASGPGRAQLGPGEWIATVKIPPSGGVSGFRKLAGRFSMAISIVNLAWRWTVDEGGTLSGVRLAAGAVAPTVVRCRRAEHELEGRRPSPEVLAGAAAAIRADISPIDDVRASARYRKEAIQGLLEEALLACTAGTAGEKAPSGA